MYMCVSQLLCCLHILLHRCYLFYVFARTTDRSDLTGPLLGPELSLVRPISLLTLTLLTLLDSNFPGNPPWALEFDPFELSSCSSQTL